MEISRITTVAENIAFIKKKKKFGKQFQKKNDR